MRVSRLYFRGQANAIDRARHNNVTENKINLGPLGQQFQRRFGRVAIDGVITEMIEQRGRNFTDFGTIIDNQYHRALRTCGLGNFRRIDFRACIGWQIDCNRGPESNFAFRTYRSACLMRKAVNFRNCAPDQAASNGAPMRDAFGLKSLAKSASMGPQIHSMLRGG